MGGVLKIRTLCVAAVMGLGGCSVDDPAAGAGAVINTDPIARQVTTLMASVGVEVDGKPLAAGHLVEARVSVDGHHWGVFGFAGEPPADWQIDTPDGTGPALLRAAIAEDLTLIDDAPDTVGGWHTFLARALPAGDHVFQMTELTLRNGDGDEISISSSAWVPFRVEAGDGTAWIGDLVFTVDALP